MSAPRATLIVTVADDAIFEANARASTEHEVASGAVERLVVRGAHSQASALNNGLAWARADLVVCPHQDVAFAPGWLERLEELAASAPAPWGVLGMAGTTDAGKMYGTHSGLGMDSYRHVTVQTLDGSCLVLRRSSGLLFDEALDRFHGYDVDICLESWARGLAVYAVDVPMAHNTTWASVAGSGASDLHNALAYVARKWHGRGVGSIHTTFGTY